MPSHAPDLATPTYSDADALLDDLLSDDTDTLTWREYINIPSTYNEANGRDHTEQRRFIESKAKRKIIRAGRRGGKTFGIAILALMAFAAGKRVLYTAPTSDQVGAFWFAVSQACHEAVGKKLLRKNEGEHFIEVPHTRIRIKAKTAWNADTLRGDHADLLIFDEFQLTNEDAWGVVGAPMLLDNDGDAVFIYTPPSLHSRSVTKARDPKHAAKLFAKHTGDPTGRWETFHFRSHDNPFISEDALAELTSDMTATAIRQEIEAEDTDESPGALWKRAQLDTLRITAMDDDVSLRKVVIGVDPPGGRTECGIVVSGVSTQGRGYVLDDRSTDGSPAAWGLAAVQAYLDWDADWLIGETNYGGDMVEHVIRNAAETLGVYVNYKTVTATRGKAIRAEPVAANYERELVQHVGHFQKLEAEMCEWEPDQGMTSPNRLDALVWTMIELMPPRRQSIRREAQPDVLAGWRG